MSGAETKPGPEGSVPVVVTQADREAAFGILQLSLSNSEERARLIAEGARDDDPLVQAFARHRIATQADALAVMREAEGAIVKAREALHFHYVEWDGEPEDAVPLQLARSDCDTTLANLSAAIARMGGA